MLQIIRNNPIVLDGKPNSTALGASNGFIIQLYENEYYNTNKECWRLNQANIKSIRGVSTENLNISFSTDWTETGGAKLGKMVTGYLNGTLFKAAASQSDKGFQPMILSDEWTQKKMNGSSPIKIDLTFKLYKDKSLAGSGYQEAILFLTHICAPPKRVKLGTDSVDLIKRVGDGVYNIATEVMNSGKAMMNSEMNTFAGGAATLVNAANDIYNKATSQAILGRNNGNFTVLLSFGEKIYSHNSMQMDTSSKTVNGNIDWIVTNFTFTPSTQFEWDDDKKLPMPLWCDFKVSLETRLTLSNKYVYDLLHKDILNLKTEPV